MRLLIVDDDKQITNFLKKTLESECYVVDCANDGKQGSYLARINEYDTIILDLNLPQKDGLTVCSEIRNDNIKTPILILSARSETPTKVELLEAGADDYLTKPFSFEELLARIKAVNRRPRNLEDEIISIGDLVINKLKNEVIYKNNKVTLTRKEFALLEYLALNKDRVISRGAILEHVWDMNADPFSNSIEVHIRTIRQKLGLSQKNELIKTISGRGYMIESENLSHIN